MKIRAVTYECYPPPTGIRHPREKDLFSPVFPWVADSREWRIAGVVQRISSATQGKMIYSHAPAVHDAPLTTRRAFRTTRASTGTLWAT